MIPETFARHFLLLVLALGAAFAQDGAAVIAGRVSDPSGSVIVGARVTAQASHFRDEVRTDRQGKFVINCPRSEEVAVAVSAPGFDFWSEEISSPHRALEIVLKPAKVVQSIVVTPARTSVDAESIPESIRVIRAEALAHTAALTLDDALRQIPGFTLFRRSGSRTANPTSQGVSSRGIGASGASRVLVLEDYVPLNDPFGGWIYWQRIPKEEIASIEVMQGGASQLYGADALSGVVNVIPKTSDQISLETSVGNERSPEGSIFAAHDIEGWRPSISSQFFSTKGYGLVPDDARGRVDTPANTNDRVVAAKLERKLYAANLFLAGSVFRESRNNGTPLQTNRTSLGEGRVGADLPAGSGAIAFRAYFGGQTYHQTFSAIAADRNSETLTASQVVPAQQAGGTLQWVGSISAKHIMSLGVEMRQLHGFTDDTNLALGKPLALVASGGTQTRLGFFVQDRFNIGPRLFFSAGIRGDEWSNTSASTRSTPLSGAGSPSLTVFGDRRSSAISPRVSLLFQATNVVAFTASGYRAFRAPTLNELYRPFRLGNVLTLANQQLGAETLNGGELGAKWTHDSIGLRATAFYGQVANPIANATLSITSALITRQRQNLGSTRSAGADFNVDWRPSDRLSFTAGYQFVSAEVASFPGNRTLEGKRIPQVPAHQLSLQASYARPYWSLGLQARASSGQFDDDLNLFPLDSFFTADAYASRQLRPGVDMFVAVENLFDERYMVGRTPVATLGPPILARAGLKINFPRAR